MNERSDVGKRKKKMKRPQSESAKKLSAKTILCARVYRSKYGLIVDGWPQNRREMGLHLTWQFDAFSIFWTWWLCHVYYSVRFIKHMRARAFHACMKFSFIFLWVSVGSLCGSRSMEHVFSVKVFDFFVFGPKVVSKMCNVRYIYMIHMIRIYKLTNSFRMSSTIKANFSSVQMHDF